MLQKSFSWYPQNYYCRDTSIENAHINTHGVTLAGAEELQRSLVQRRYCRCRHKGGQAWPGSCIKKDYLYVRAIKFY